jgi:hypothetical protein
MAAFFVLAPAALISALIPALKVNVPVVAPIRRRRDSSRHPLIN